MTDRQTKITWKKTLSLLYRTVADYCISCVIFLVAADLSFHLTYAKV